LSRDLSFPHPRITKIIIFSHQNGLLQSPTIDISLFGRLVVDGWCWFVLREEYCWLVVGGWFILREKYCWLVADKPSEQADGLKDSQGNH
jgi:hypothetical protein